MPISFPLLSKAGAPTDGVNEAQLLTKTGTISGGSFTVTFGAATTPAVDWDATAAELQAILEALTTVGAGNITVTDANELQALTPGGTVSGGSFTLTFDSEETAALDFDSTAAEIQTALEGLTTVGAGNVLCTGGPVHSDPVIVEFVGDLAGLDQPEIVVDDALLTGAGAEIVASTTQHGGSFTLTFAGDLAGLNQGEVTVDDALLTGAGATITPSTVTAGVRGSYRGAHVGALLQDTTNSILYLNEGTENTPDWNDYSA